LANRYDLTPGRWRLWLFLWPVPVVLAALLTGPLMMPWKVALVPLLVLLCLAEWRRQHVPVSVLFAGDTLALVTRDGRVWEPLLPLHRFQCPLCLALRCGSAGTVRWLTVYVDELPAAPFARLNRMAGQGIAADG
jgi:hypothetical protein